MTATGQFVTQPELTAISRSYKNPDYTFIAEEALPEVSVGRRTFKYTAFPETTHFDVPDTRVGPRSSPNKVEMESSEENGNVHDYAIDIPLDKETREEAEKDGLKPRNLATERGTNILKLDREIRVSQFVADQANYASGNVIALSGTDQFNDYTNSTPFDVIDDYMDKCLIRPNQLVLGHAVFKKLRRHPQLVEYVRGSSTAKGVLTKQELAELFGVKRVLVGETLVNANRPGQAMNLERVWTNVVAGHFIDRTVAPTTGGVTFGFTARKGKRFAGSVPADMGAHGGEYIRSAETMNEVGIAPHAGFLIQNAIL